MALIGEGDDLADHLRCPVQTQMRGGALGRFPLGHGGVEIADLIGHAHEFVDLAGRQAANPPLASSFPSSKHKAWSRRATAITRTPNRRARSSASEVGAETDTSVPAPKIAALATISNEQRLVMTKNPLSGATPGARERADRLVERIVPPDVLADQDDCPVSSAPRRGVDGAGQLIEGLSRLQFLRAARIAAGAIGACGWSGGRGEGICEKSSMPQRPQPVRPLIARPRARCACSRSPESAILSFQPSSTLLDLDAANILDALGDLLGQRKAVGEIFEVLRRRHHDGEGRAADDDLNRAPRPRSLA